MRQRAHSLPCVCKGKKYVCTGYDGIITRHGNHVSDFCSDTGILAATGTGTGSGNHEQVQATELSDSGTGMDHPGNTSDVTVNYYLLRSGHVAGT